jgi:hypothetical protein
VPVVSEWFRSVSFLRGNWTRILRGCRVGIWEANGSPSANNLRWNFYFLCEKGEFIWVWVIIWGGYLFGAGFLRDFICTFMSDFI